MRRTPTHRRNVCEFSLIRCGEPQSVVKKRIPTIPAFWTEACRLVTRMDISVRENVTTCLYIYKSKSDRYIYTGFGGYGFSLVSVSFPRKTKTSRSAYVQSLCVCGFRPTPLIRQLLWSGGHFACIIGLFTYFSGTNHATRRQTLCAVPTNQASRTVQTTAHPSTNQGTRLRWQPPCRDRQQDVQGLPTQSQTN